MQETPGCERAEAVPRCGSDGTDAAEVSRSRRAVLGSVPALAAALAGCGGLGGESGSGSPTATDDERSPTAAPSPTDTPVSATPTPTPTPTPATAATTSSSPVFPGYETTTVTVETPAGDRLGSVTAAIADTGDLRYTGLSDTPSMPDDHGMLFVYGGVEERTFVMRRMDFPLDMVFADGDGRITVIHQAPPPGPGEDGNDIRRSGRARYILELNRGWSAERGVEAGDLLQFSLP